MTGAAPTAQQSSKFLPSIGHIIFLGTFFILTLGGDERLLGDGDTGYHIRAGEYILNNLTIPRTDIFSYLTPPLQWTLHEWLSEVVMAIVHRLAGLTGIVIFFAFLISLGCYLAFDLLLRPRSNLLFAAVAALLVVLGSSSNWLARPHVFTLVIFVIWYHLLNNYQYRGENRLIFLPPMMLLWVNLHGGFILGLILLGIYLAGNLAMSLYAPPGERKHRLGQTGHLAKITVACGLAAVANPYGYESLLFPFRVVQDKFLMDHIVEYLSPNFHFSSAIPFEIMLLTTIAIFAVSGARLNMIELALILLFGHMALFSSRHMPLFAMVAGPIVLHQANLAFDQLDGRFFACMRERFENLRHMEQSTNRLGWPAAGVVSVLTLALTGTIGHSFNEKYVPKAAVEFIRNEGIKGNMFNNDEFGDYIIYAAWPAYKVFIDGRTDMYGAARVKEYLKVVNAEEGWQEILDKYKITWAFHNPNSVLSKLLLEKNDWKLVYADKVAHIFVKALPQYSEIIGKYRGAKPLSREITYTN